MKMKKVVIFGSTRKDGDKAKLKDRFTDLLTIEKGVGGQLSEKNGSDK